MEVIRFAFRTGAAFGATELFGLLTAGTVIALSVQSTSPDTPLFGCLLGVAAVGFLVTAIPCLIFALVCSAVARHLGWLLSLSISAALTLAIFFIVLREWPHGSKPFTNVLLGFSIASGLVGMAAARGVQTVLNRRDAQHPNRDVFSKAADGL